MNAQIGDRNDGICLQLYGQVSRYLVKSILFQVLYCFGEDFWSILPYGKNSVKKLSQNWIPA